MALVKAALEQGESAQWTTDIVPDDKRGTGPGMAGSAVTILKSAHVIEPVGIVNDGVFFARRQASERPGAKARWLNVYQLVSSATAKSFLEKNKVAPLGDGALGPAGEAPAGAREARALPEDSTCEAHVLPIETQPELRSKPTSDLRPPTSEL